MSSAPAARIRVMVVFGGRSSEHQISCATASGVLGAIDRERYDVLPVGITRAGAWVLEDDDAAKFRLDPEHMPEVLDNGTRILMPDSANTREVRVLRDGAISSLGDIDIVLPLLHGPFGEDGTVQGMLELAGLPFVGSKVLAASVGMDKHFTKLVLAAAGLRVAPGTTVSELEWATDADGVRARVAEFGLPVFVKPARAGSSVGVSKVKSADELDAAMRVAFAEDDHVLVEQGIVGREIEIAVLGSRRGERPRASVAGEIVIGETAEFYDYSAKYLDDTAVRLDCPAALSDAELAEAQELALRAFEALGAEGLSRVDFFLDDEGFLVNEVNTMPGFTPISMFPKCWQASGLEYPELITELLEVALSRAGADARSAA